MTRYGKCLSLLLFFFAVPFVQSASLMLADGGKTDWVIVQQPGASAAEKFAATELAETLKQITGAAFPVQEAGPQIPLHAIIVGQGAAASSLFPEVPFEKLGLEELVIKTKGGRLLLAGGWPRGTVYAVAQFLQDQCGVRWWTPWASRMPANSNLTVQELNVRYTPVFESRDPYWFPAFNARWAAHNFSNSQNTGLKDDMGGAIVYKGFVHTAYYLVPPGELFAKHPDWFAEVKGKRVSEGSQLCLMNPEMREYAVGRVKQWLRESPEARIISVSQNDCFNPCECPLCKPVDDAEGSHAGTMLNFVNYVAEKIEPEFPNVAVDTLAYQYTRKPPKTIRPRPNVIVRLCSIECNFGEPLDSPVNKSFANDIQGWSAICNRLYIWDYTTDFAHYLQPHPNWFALGPNVHFFATNHVRGVFEQGAYQSYGSEFTELRAWVLAQLLWRPTLNDRALINEFLDGYYGPAAGPIRQYMELMHGACKGWNLGCFAGTDAPFDQFKTLAEAEKLWEQAEASVANEPAYSPRVRSGRIWLGYVWLTMWDKLHKQCDEAGGKWPVAASKKEFAATWLKWTQGDPALPWTKIAYINEGEQKPEDWAKPFLKD